MSLIQITKRLSEEISKLKFSNPVTHVYNPLEYAWTPHAKFLEKYGQGKKKILFLGMNPGPFGMTQTGVPFGEISRVRDWLKISGPVDKPRKEHNKRPVLGFQCEKSEVSGTRFWGWIEQKFKSPEVFFKDHFVWTYCPLVFMEASGKNRTPEQLPIKEALAVSQVCQKALKALINELNCQALLAIGRYAETEGKKAVAEAPIPVHYMFHPSPMSPLANKGWAELAEKSYSQLCSQLKLKQTP